MALIKVEIEVAKESYELGQGLVGFIRDIKTALANGWQVGEDLPPILASAMANLVPHIQDYQKIIDEATAETGGFIKGTVVSGADIYDALK